MSEGGFGKSNMKRNLTLDFNQVKKNSLNLALGGSVLSSPDLNMLKVETPELEKMILSNNITNTPTPSLAYRPLPEDPETFASGFVNALNNLHNANTSQASLFSPGSDSSSGNVYTDLEQSNLNFIPPVIKDEPQTVPNMGNSPPMSPVDMEAQEKIKLERKRQRNRLAASKCRTRKLERISRLEDKVKHLKTENQELAVMIKQLREHVGLLKVEVMDHVQAGCQIIMQF